MGFFFPESILSVISYILWNGGLERTCEALLPLTSSAFMPSIVSADLLNIVIKPSRFIDMTPAAVFSRIVSMYALLRSSSIFDSVREIFASSSFFLLIFRSSVILLKDLTRIPISSFASTSILKSRSPLAIALVPSASLWIGIVMLLAR